MNHPDRMESLARQLNAEHREGIAADRLERERRAFTYDIEGWDGDSLRIYIAGSGLHVLPADVVWRLGSDLLAEHQMHHHEEE